MIRSRVLGLGKQGQINFVWYRTTVTSSQTKNVGNSREIIEDFALQEARISFARAKIGTFFQDIPKLGNQYKEDIIVQSYLKRILPDKVSSVLGQNCKLYKS